MLCRRYRDSFCEPQAVQSGAAVVVLHSYLRGLVGGGLSGSAALMSPFHYSLRVYQVHWGRMAGDSVPVVVFGYTVTHSSAVQNDLRSETVGYATLTRSRWW